MPQISGDFLGNFLVKTAFTFLRHFYGHWATSYSNLLVTDCCRVNFFIGDICSRWQHRGPFVETSMTLVHRNKCGDDLVPEKQNIILLCNFCYRQTPRNDDSRSRLCRWKFEVIEGTITPRLAMYLGKLLCCKLKTCGQSYKGSRIVNYDSRVVIWGNFKSGTTLES